MSKLCKCKACGAEIAKSAKTCPQCGAKNKRKHPVLGVLLLLFGILLIAAALGDGDSPEKVGASTATQPAATTPELFQVGDVVSLRDIEVTFVSCEESTGAQFMSPEEGNVFLVCEFLIDNKSSKDIAISSLMSFEAYVDNFTTNMSLTGTLASDKTQLDGTVAAGKKMSGAIGYEVPADWKELEIRFTPDFWSGKDITFVATHSNEGNVDVSSPKIVDNDSMTVTFVKAEDYSSLGVFYVYLKIENKTDADLLINLDSADVDGETIPLITTGVPLVIRPGNSGQTGFIFSMANLSISSMDEAEQATFRINAWNNDSMDIVSQSDLVTVNLH